MTIIWFLILSFQLDLLLGQEESPIVTIPDGALRGTVNKTVDNNITFYAFRGIPFAKNPIGNLRFANPVKNDPWVGTLNATEDKDSCTQSGSSVLGRQAGILGSEDCLYINVYTTNINGNLPVMVWIYGGGFVGGTSKYESYGPDYLLEKNITYVSFNYRLGVFGFLSTEDSASPGNWGLKDQVLALKWVKENIQYFGGDPSKVTIFGESAGGASVSYLLQTNLTTGLFSGAIAQSGSSLCLWALTQNARRKAFNVGANLGIFTLNSQTLINNLRKVDYKKLSFAESNVTAAALLTDNILAGLPFGVVKEPNHPDAIFSDKSHQMIKEGQTHKVPVIIGYNSDEGAALKDYIDVVRPIFFQYDLDRSRLAPHDLTQNFLKRLRAGIEIRNHYFRPEPLGNQPEAIARFFTVDQFNRPIREQVHVASAHTTVYYYKFSYKGLLGDLSVEGVGHSEELNYLFSRGRPSTAEDNLTRDKFVTLWTNFAKTGNPTPTDTGSILGNQIWEPNTPSDNTDDAIKYLNINNTLTMGINPDQSDREFYQDIYRRFGDPPYTTY